MTFRTTLALVIAASSAAMAHPASALQDNPVHTHVGHVATAFAGTPDGQGLLPMAIAEVEAALGSLNRAAGDTSNLDWMQRHAADALYAMDPSRGTDGTGLGFGVIAAADGIVQHIELAAAADGASETVTTHAPHIAAAARAVSARAAAIAEMAEEVAAARDYTSAETLINRMRREAQALTDGSDENEDGEIALDEGGLAYVEQHLGFILAGEGLE